MQTRVRAGGPIMPPLMAPTQPVWKDQGEVAPPSALDWNNPEDRRIMRREHQRNRNTEKRAERRTAIAANQRAFSGRVEIGPQLRALIDYADTAKDVVTSHHRHARRGTFTGTVICGEHAYRGHFVVLQDARSNEAACAEIVWTGKDWRIHVWRASTANEQQPVLIDVRDTRN